MLTWHEPEVTRVKKWNIPIEESSEPVTGEMMQFVKECIDATKVMQDDLLMASNRLQKPDVRVMTYLFGSTIGKNVDHARHNVIEASRISNGIKKVGEKDVLLKTDIEFLERMHDKLSSIHGKTRELLGMIPGRDNVEDMIFGSLVSYDRGQHVPIFKGDRASTVANWYKPSNMPSHHYERATNRLPPYIYNIYEENPVILREWLIYQLSMNGRNGWKKQRMPSGSLAITPCPGTNVVHG